MTEVKRYEITEPYLKLNCGLGEAPFWEEKTNTLRFVDIVKQKIHTVNLDEGPSSHQEHSLDISVGTTADIDGIENKFAFAGKHGFGVMDRKTMKYKYTKRYWDGDQDRDRKEHRLRGNDGHVDCRGRFWVGIMNDPLVTEPTNEGVIMRLDPDMSLHRVKEGVAIPNGITWSKDNKTMFMSDSPSKKVLAYDYDSETGSISNERLFFEVKDEDSVPDGHCWDAEGYLWQAIHGCGKVVRISPEGDVVAEIILPTRCPTCPGFAGEYLFITSSEEESPDKYPESVKYQGSLFRCHVGVSGQELYRFPANKADV